MPLECTRDTEGSAVTRDQEPDTQLLVDHIDAWNDHDLDGLMALFAEECVFDASRGTDAHGQRFVGNPAVRDASAAVFERLPDAHWGARQHLNLGADQYVSTWTLTGTFAGGSRMEVEGCDFLTVNDGLITRKHSFRKQRPPIQPPR